MRKSGLQILMVMILSLNMICAIGQIDLGFYAGSSMLKPIGDKPRYSLYKSDRGIITGTIINIPITKDIKLSFEPAFYLDKAKFRTADTMRVYFKKKLEYRDSIDFRFNIVMLPLLIKVISDNERFQFTSGFELMYVVNVSADNGIEKKNLKLDNYNLAVSAQFGVGYIIPVKQSNLSVNLQYSHSLNNLENDDSGISYLKRVRIRSTRLVLAWTIPVNRKNNKSP
jgi:hypothetical protein